MRTKLLLLGSTFFLLGQTGLSKEKLTETKLLELYKQSQSEAFYSKQASEAELESLIHQFNSKFDPMFIGTLGAINTNQDPIPYTSQAERTYSTSVGIKKNFDFGTSATASYAYRKMALGKYQDPSTPGPSEMYAPAVNLNVGISLLKNFLGSLDSAQEDEINASKALNTEKNKIQDNAILSQIRTFYWRYGLLEDMKKVKNNLLSAAYKQRSQLKQRSDRGIADNADLARNQASIAQQKSDIVELEADQLEIIRYVLQLIGNTSANAYKYSFHVDPSSLSQCIARISNTPQTPKEWSSYTDFLSSLNFATQSSVEKIKKQHPA